MKFRHVLKYKKVRRLCLVHSLCLIKKQTFQSDDF